MADKTLYQKKIRLGDGLLKGSIYAAAALTFTVLLGLMGYLLVRGLPHISWGFLSHTYSETDPQQNGILPMLLNTLYVVGITVLIAGPVGIASAVYLTQYAKQGRFVAIVRFAAEVLSGIPSILFGLFGYTVFCQLLRLGTSLLAGCLTMALCVLPTLIRTTEEALLSVPRLYTQGAMALGVGKLRVILGILLPNAMPGILTALVLTMGRIVGESAALLFTAGMSYGMPRGVFSHAMESGRTLTLHLYQTAREAATPDAMNVAFGTAAVLLILIFLLNRIAWLLGKVLKKGES